MKAIETVGILGLGKMGGPIAGHLVARGFKVIGYDPVAGAREQAAARGARGAASARELARSSELVIVHGRLRQRGRRSHLRQGRRARGREAGPHRRARLDGCAALFDAARRTPCAAGPRSSRHPACARGSAAMAGKLLIYGAGDPDAFELCRPVFGAFASDIFHLGPAAPDRSRSWSTTSSFGRASQ